MRENRGIEKRTGKKIYTAQRDGVLELLFWLLDIYSRGQFQASNIPKFKKTLQLFYLAVGVLSETLLYPYSWLGVGMTLVNSCLIEV